MLRDAATARPTALVVAGGAAGSGVSTLGALLVLAAQDAGVDAALVPALAAATTLIPAFPVLDAGTTRAGVLAALVHAGARPTMLLVPGTDRNSIAAAHAAAKVAALESAHVRFVIVPSRVDHATAQWAGAALTASCEQYLERAVRVAPVIPDDPSLALALAAGMPVGDAADGSPAADVVRALCHQLLLIPVPTAAVHGRG